MKLILSATIAVSLLMAPRMAAAMEISLFPAAEFDQVYNTNVGVTAHDRKADWVTAELLGGKLEARSPTRDLYLNYSTVFSEDASYSNLDQFARDHFIQANDTEQLSRAATLTVSDTFLRGNATSAQFFSDSTEPIGLQLMSALLYNSTTDSNSFAAQYHYVHEDTLALTSEVHQDLFSANSTSTGANSTLAGLSFDQGGLVAVDRLWGERFTIGGGYQFDDFRFSNSVPSSESQMPMVRLGWGAGTPFSLMASAGPRIISSSSGIIGTSAFSGDTKIEPGFLVAANYTGERLSLRASAGETSGLSAGLGGQTNNIIVSSLVQYRLTRRSMLFANIGYFDFSGTGSNGYTFSYAAGASYRLTRHISVTAEYYGFRTLDNGAGAGALVASPGQTVATNVFLLGVVFQASPFKWVID